MELWFKDLQSEMTFPGPSKLRPRPLLLKCASLKLFAVDGLICFVTLPLLLSAYFSNYGGSTGCRAYS